MSTVSRIGHRRPSAHPSKTRRHVRTVLLSLALATLSAPALANDNEELGALVELVRNHGDLCPEPLSLRSADGTFTIRVRI